MSMNFRVIKSAIVNLLGSNEFDRFQTIGYQRQRKSAEQIQGSKRTVDVFYVSGNFPRDGGSVNGGPNRHDLTFSINLSASASSKVDLATLNAGSTTDPEAATALREMQEGARIVDDNFDEFVEIIYQILMDSRNTSFGLEKGVVASRWVDQIEKNNLEDKGELNVLTGSMILTCNTDEEVLGEVGVPLKTIDGNIAIDGDDTGKAGVKVDYA